MNFTILRTAMVDNQIRPSDVTRYDMLAALLDTPREQFAPSSYASLAYAEMELPVLDASNTQDEGRNHEHERKMMTPRSFAKLLSLADPKPDEQILLIGAGGGYEAAVLSALCDNLVVFESDERMAVEAEKRLIDAECLNVVVVQKAQFETIEAAGPYDRVIVNGALEAVEPWFFDHLSENGAVYSYMRKDGVTSAVQFSSPKNSRTAFEAAAPLLNLSL